MRLEPIVLVATLLFAGQAQSQTPVPTPGALVIVPASGQVTQANDQVTATFAVAETGVDKAAVASRANRKMMEGIAILRAQDPGARLKTTGYYTRPQYKKGKADRDEEPREIIGWEVEQRVEVTTQNLAGLPKMAAAAQKVLGLDRLHFHLSDATMRKLDDRRIAAAYRNLNERIASIAEAMGRKVSDATVETVDFEGAGNRVNYQHVQVTGSRIRKEDYAEPSFEAGETTIEMSLVGKVKFK